MKKFILVIILIVLIGCSENNKQEPKLDSDSLNNEQVEDKDLSEEVDDLTIEEEIQILIEKKNALIEEKKQAAKTLVGKEKSDKMKDINNQISKVSQEIGDLKRKLNKWDNKSIIIWQHSLTMVLCISK